MAPKRKKGKKTKAAEEKKAEAPTEEPEEKGEEEKEEKKLIDLDEYFPNLNGKKIRHNGETFTLLRVDDGTYVITKAIPADQVDDMEEWLEYSSVYNPNNPEAKYPNQSIFNFQKGSLDENGKQYCGRNKVLRRALILQMFHDEFYPEYQFKQPFKKFTTLGNAGYCFQSGKGIGSLLSVGSAGTGVRRARAEEPAAGGSASNKRLKANKRSNDLFATRQDIRHLFAYKKIFHQ
jgi:hypothetical protein